MTYTVDIDVVTSDADNLIVTATVPNGMTFLDVTLGAPASVVVNADGTTTLTWSLGTVAPGTTTIVFTARVDGDAPYGADLTTLVTAVHDTLDGPVTTTDSVTVTVTTPAAEDVVTPIVFPNPSSGSAVSVQIGLGSDALDVKLQVFTTAYRKIMEKDLGPMQAGGGINASSVRATAGNLIGRNNTVLLELKDAKGKPLANGVYYIVVLTEKGKAIGKFLILR